MIGGLAADLAGVTEQQTRLANAFAARPTPAAAAPAAAAAAGGGRGGKKIADPVASTTKDTELKKLEKVIAKVETRVTAVETRVTALELAGKEGGMYR